MPASTAYSGDIDHQFRWITISVLFMIAVEGSLFPKGWVRPTAEVRRLNGAAAKRTLEIANFTSNRDDPEVASTRPDAVVQRPAVG